MKLRKIFAGFGLLLAASLPQACATNHLIQWSKGKPSMYQQPTDEKKPFLHPAGAVLFFPVAVTWDAVTFPFQWLWDTYPYGEEVHPKSEID